MTNPDDLRDRGERLLALADLVAAAQEHAPDGTIDVRTEDEWAMLNVVLGDPTEDDDRYGPQTDDDPDADTDTEDAAVDDGSNPYAPTVETEVAVNTTTDGRPMFNIPPIICEEFEEYDRVHFRETDNRVELVGGDSTAWPDYSLGTHIGVENSRVIEEMLDVVPGDGVTYRPDGDIIVVDAHRTAERHVLGEQPESFSEREQAIVDALKDEGEMTTSDLKMVTERDNGIYKQLNELETEDIIEKRDDPEDARRTLISLTDDFIERSQAEAVFS